MDTAGAFVVRDTVKSALYEIKISVLGDSAVGKTSITSCFRGIPLNSSHKATICCELMTKSVVYGNGDTVRYTVYDTAGQERFQSMMPNYVRNMDAVIIVYDVTSMESFKHVEKWLGFVMNYLSCEVPVVLVGNKIDMVDEREVKMEEGMFKAEKYNLFFLETSAKTGEKVVQVFQHLSTALREQKMYQLFHGARIPLSQMAKSVSPAALKSGSKNGAQKKSCCS